jgi:hypothetical protein
VNLGSSGKHTTTRPPRATFFSFILNRFLSELSKEERLYGYFQQDSAMMYTAGNSMATISEVFSDRVISEGLWPAHSSYLMSCDFYFWGDLKDRVYKRNPYTLHELEGYIWEEIYKISP